VISIDAVFGHLAGASAGQFGPFYHMFRTGGGREIGAEVHRLQHAIRGGIVAPMSFVSQRTAAIALAISVTCILAGSLYPFEYRTPASGPGPVTTLLLSSTRWPQWGDFLRNIVFYALMGMLAGLVMPARAAPVQRLSVIVLFGSVLSLGNEMLQYYVGRYTNAFDVYANALGTALGALTSSLAGGGLGRRPG